MLKAVNCRSSQLWCWGVLNLKLDLFYFNRQKHLGQWFHGAFKHGPQLFEEQFIHEGYLKMVLHKLTVMWGFTRSTIFKTSWQMFSYWGRRGPWHKLFSGEGFRSQMYINFNSLTWNILREPLLSGHPNTRIKTHRFRANVLYWACVSSNVGFH